MSRGYFVKICLRLYSSWALRRGLLLSVRSCCWVSLAAAILLPPCHCCVCGCQAAAAIFSGTGGPVAFCSWWYFHGSLKTLMTCDLISSLCSKNENEDSPLPVLKCIDDVHVVLRETYIFHFSHDFPFVFWIRLGFLGTELEATLSCWHWPRKQWLPVS